MWKKISQKDGEFSVVSRYSTGKGTHHCVCPRRAVGSSYSARTGAWKRWGQGPMGARSAGDMDSARRNGRGMRDIG